MRLRITISRPAIVRRSPLSIASPSVSKGRSSGMLIRAPFGSQIFCLENPIWMFNHRGPRRRMNSGKGAFTSKTLHHCAELQVFRLQASEDRQPCTYIAFGSRSAIYLIEPLGYTKSAVNHCSLAQKQYGLEQSEPLDSF